MVEVNPDPHADGYLFIPTNRVTSIFGSRDDARKAVRELQAMGFADDRLEVFVGEAGAEVLDLSGESHGPATRRLRNLEALLSLETGESHRLADEALRAGGVVVVVRMDERDTMKQRVAEILKQHNGAVVRYWSRWTLEKLD